MPTIKTVLSEATLSLESTSESAALDCEVLLSKALNTNRSYLRAWPDHTLTEDQHQQFVTWLQERQSGKPVAYITGIREFWSREFIVTPDVLIPRPDTELLIELSLKLLLSGKPANLLDLGTGSGAIALTLAAERPFANVYASDNSPAALTVAKRNAEKHQLDNIRFFLSNWFNELPKTNFSLIISNPPYIAKNDCHLQQGDVRFEPTSALSADQEGLADIKCIAESAQNYLEDDGHLLIEHGYNQHCSVHDIFNCFGYQKIKAFKDLSGQFRVTCGQKASAR
jgi:release factor glutamine methyltransferase